MLKNYKYWGESPEKKKEEEEVAGTIPKPWNKYLKSLTKIGKWPDKYVHECYIYALTHDQLNAPCVACTVPQCTWHQNLPSVCLCLACGKLEGAMMGPVSFCGRSAELFTKLVHPEFHVLQVNSFRCWSFHVLIVISIMAKWWSLTSELRVFMVSRKAVRAASV